MTPLLGAKGTGGHNSYLTLVLSRLYTNVNALSSLSWRVGHGALRRQLFYDWRHLDSEITMSHVRC